MKFPFTFLLLAHSSSAQNDLRHEDTNFLRSRELSPLSEDCTILFIEFHSIDEGPDIEGQFACERTGGFIHRIEFFDDDQKERMMNQLKSGELLSGTSILKKESIGFLPEGERDGVIYLPPGLDSITIETSRDLHRRRLDGDVFGDKPILGVRVTDADGKVYPHNAQTMRDKIFGTDGDPVNLKSQLFACSHGQLNIVDMGVIDVTIDKRLTVHDKATIENAIAAAVNAKLGISLPGPYEHVMYMLEACYRDCGWGGYAGVYHWRSVYQDVYYSFPDFQVHELGHNFGLAHSGIEGGDEYGDHTCMMGSPPNLSDDVGRMCYNPAKNWQLGWYNDTKDTIDITVANVCETRTLYGIANYDSNAASTVIIKLETGDTWDYYVGFNRATGANADNIVAADKVTLVWTDEEGESYSQSWLEEWLSQGQRYTLEEGVRITVDTINIRANPGYAIVTFKKGTCGGTPTASPVTKAPTTDDDDYYDDDDGECSDGEKFAVTAKRTKNCSWLASRPNTNLIKNFCRNKWNYKDGYGPPNKECRLTCDPYVSSCDSCFEYFKSKFILKRNKRNKNVFRTCKWLSKRTDSQKNQFCNQDSVGSLPKANVICPQTCNNCNR